MSVSSRDVFPEFHGSLLEIGAPASQVADLTEDLAEEVTSELAPAAPLPRAALEAGYAVQSSPGNVLRERYVLETPLGSGGNAVVYRAVDLRRDAGVPEGRRVAVKLLRPELRDRPECIARLQREFRQTQSVGHPNVVRFHDLDCDHGAWFIVMELLSGETLGPRLRRVAPAGLPQSEALAIAAAIGDALGQAHARGVIHGDIKPDNIYLPASGAPRLLDFGVAPDSSAPEPAEPEIRPAAAATRAYASPEVLAGEDPAPADDVFSLACVTYETLSGVHPYRRQSRDVASRDAAAPQPVLSLDPAQSAALSAALDLRRAARPAMAEFVAALRGERRASVATASVPVASPPPATAPIAVAAAPAGSRRARALPWRVAAPVLAMALALGFLFGRGEPDSRTMSAPAAPPAVEVAAPATSVVQDTPTPELTGPPRSPAKAEAPATEKAAMPAAKAARPGLVSFDSPMMIVSKRAVVAAIPLRHFSRLRRGTQVTWRVVDGTARAGRDYGGATTGVENFVEGNTFRILYVPILPGARTTLDRSFAVELTGASPGTELGPTQRIEVTILGTA
jgi:serine/threonine protein kinase